MLKLLFIRATDWLGENPSVGAASGFGGLLSRSYLQNVIDVLQLLVLIASLIVSVLTIVGWFQKRKRSKKHEIPAVDTEDIEGR